jgi:integrase
MADAELAESTVKLAWCVISAIFTEAVESDYIVKNPAKHVDLPKCKKTEETSALTEDQVQLVFEKTSGQDRLMWRILFLTGVRLSAMLALEKTDLVPAGLCIDESAYNGQGADTKTGQARYVPIPDSLRREIEEWIATVPGRLMFPNIYGAMYSRHGDAIESVLLWARAATGIQDLDFRRCRTTFATLYDGDPRDLQAILGHSRIDMTMKRYKKPFTVRQQADVEELEARLSRKVVRMPAREKAV